MSKYTWIRSSVPKKLEVRQVYGVVFSDTGKVLLRFDNGKYKLTGGHPDKNDQSFEDTLKREFIEELDVEIKDIHYLGYLLVEENHEKYAQVRMIAKIKKIGPIRPDLDNGILYQRYFAYQNNVKSYLNYSDLAGNKMIDDALKLANEYFCFGNNDNENEHFE